MLMKTALDFLKDNRGQDFAEYALVLSAIGLIAIAVIVRFRTEIIATFNQAINNIRAARGS
jgi:Flp pilus assembly pilin Flp